MDLKKILIVDDSDVILMMERMILQKTGMYELVSAKCGREAIEKAETEKPDLILLDVVMPGMSGFEVCQELRTIASTKDIPIIIVTTRGEADNVENGYASGCNDYVTKPIDGGELLAKLESILGEVDRP
jgi:CheY-like chemotaxis protein